MALETGTYISDLVTTNPPATDGVSQADDHLRLIKSTVKATFPNITGAVTATHTDLNKLTASGSPQFSTIELGNASDTTISRSAAGVISVEGVPVPLNSTTSTHTAQQIELGHASDTTITRSAAGVIAVEGGVVPKENRANTFSANQQIIVTGSEILRLQSSTANGGYMNIVTDNGTTQNYIGSHKGIYLTGNATDLAVYATNNLTLGTNGAERMRINASGNVGIGTSVVASNTLRYFDLQNIDTGASAGAIMRLVTSDAAGSGITTVDFVKYKNGSFYLNNNETGASGLIGFGVGGTERLRITANGGVSFGSSGTAYGTSGQVLKSNGDAPPSWTNAGAVLLGTLTTTSGTSQTLSSLVLTPYKFLRLVFNGVSGSSTGVFSFGSFQLNGTATAGDAWIGIVDVDLATGIGASNLAASAGGSVNRVGSTGYTTASTSVSLTVGAGTFDAGSVAVYGVA